LILKFSRKCLSYLVIFENRKLGLCDIDVSRIDLDRFLVTYWM